MQSPTRVLRAHPMAGLVAALLVAALGTVTLATRAMNGEALLSGNGSAQRPSSSNGQQLGPAEEPGPGQSPGTVWQEPPNSDPNTFASPSPGINQAGGTLPLKVTIEPRCAKRGDALIARIETEPKASINLAVAYDNGQSYGQYGIIFADAEGKASYPWAIPPDAPYGKGRLLLGSNTEDASAVGIWEFMVTRSGRC